MHSTNDQFFDPNSQVRQLSDEEAVRYASAYFDQNCDDKDAAFLKEVIVAAEDSLECALRHAAGGSPAAQLVYGVHCLHDADSGKSPSEGLFWLVRAANGGSAKAALVVAEAYRQGLHVARNPSRAFDFATLAASRGLPEAAYYLANLLIGAEGIPEDHERAVSLLQEAARAGCQPAIQMLLDNGITPTAGGDA